MASLKEYKDKIQNFYRKNKRMPSYQEMCILFSFASKNAVTKVVEKLLNAGYFEKDKTGKLVPLSTSKTFPLLGTVEAGLPTDAEESLLGTVSFDDFFTSSLPQYILTVKGLSMIDAGLCEGDLLIVEKTENAKVGDIVIACIDQEWTVKYLREKKGKAYLEPANKDFDDLYPEHSLHIGGIVKGVMRKYS
jgi:SOS regulatory protein LexA